MNVERAVQTLREMRLDLETIEVRSLFAMNGMDDPVYEEAKQRRDRRMTLVTGIFDASGVPHATKRFQAALRSHLAGRTAIGVIDEVLGHLEDEEEREAILGAQGPKLAAEELHPWIWDEAAPRWDAGFFRDAVQAAATRLFDTELPKKLGVSPLKTPADLFAAFSPNGFNGKKLRFIDIDPSSPTWESIHRGAMLVGQGCVAAIRNPRTHRLEIGEDQAALEELATLSLLARWIDDSELEP